MARRGHHIPTTLWVVCLAAGTVNLTLANVSSGDGPAGDPSADLAIDPASAPSQGEQNPSDELKQYDSVLDEFTEDVKANPKLAAIVAKLHSYIQAAMQKHKEPLVEWRDDSLSPPEDGKSNAIDVPEFVVLLQLSVAKRHGRLPWKSTGTNPAHCSGIIIEGHMIVTNAHCAVHTVEIRARRHGNADTFLATRVATWPLDDVALLTIDDKRFWENTVAVPLGDLPEPGDVLISYGYEFTKRVPFATQSTVAHISSLGRSFSGVMRTTIVSNKHIGGGFSGSPATCNGMLVGIATAGEEHCVQYVPVTTLKHCMNDLKIHGRPTGSAQFHVELQHLDTPVMREYFGLGPEYNGPTGSIGCLVMVVGQAVRKKMMARCQKAQDPAVVESTAQSGVILVAGERLNLATCEALGRPDVFDFEVGDVLLTLGGHTIMHDGSYHLSKDQTLSASTIIEEYYDGDVIDATVIRGGNVINLKVPAGTNTALIDLSLQRDDVEYLVFAGVVFCSLSLELYTCLREHPRHIFGVSFLGAFLRPQKIPHESIVVAAALIDHPVNDSAPLAGSILRAVNDIPVQGLKHMKELLDVARSEEYTKLTFAVLPGGPYEPYIFHTQTAWEAEPAILRQGQVPEPYRIIGINMPAP